MKKKKETSKETFYFSHDYNTRSDVKIKKLIGKHGYLGYGLFWALIEDLYQNENKMPLDYDLLAFDLRSSSNVVKSIINNFDLFKIDGDSFGSSSVQRRLDMRNEKSLKARQSAKKRWKGDANAMRTHDDDDANAMQTHSKSDANALNTACDRNAIKESKGKESKGKENKGKDYVDTYVSMSNAPPSTHHGIDYEAIINFFNDETQGVFGKVMYPISKNRQDSIRARIKDFGLDGFAEMVRKATRSNFLKGDNKGGFVAKFDWMIRPSNFQKIIEGNYENKQQKGFSACSESSDEEFMLHIQQGLARGLRENKATE